MPAPVLQTPLEWSLWLQLLTRYSLTQKNQRRIRASLDELPLYRVFPIKIVTT